MTETKRAYALVAELANVKPGQAVITLAGGKPYDVGVAAGKSGVIVLDTQKDGLKIEALENYWGVKSESVPKGARTKSGGAKKTGAKRGGSRAKATSSAASAAGASSGSSSTSNEKE